MIYTQEKRLWCDFWLMKVNGVLGSEDDVLRMKYDDFPIWEMDSLGNSMVWNASTLSWILFLTCANNGPPQSHLKRGRSHSSTFRTFGLAFYNQFWIFQRTKNMLKIPRIRVPSMGSLLVILTLYQLSPFWMLPKFISRKGMLFLRFPR